MDGLHSNKHVFTYQKRNSYPGAAKYKFPNSAIVDGNAVLWLWVYHTVRIHMICGSCEPWSFKKKKIKNRQPSFLF